LHLGARVDDAGPKGHLGFEILVLEVLVALKGDAVDHRVLGDVDDQDVAARTDGDVGEQAGGEQALQGAVDALRVEGISLADQQVGAHRRRLDALRALDDDFRTTGPDCAAARPPGRATSAMPKAITRTRRIRCKKSPRTNAPDQVTSCLISSNTLK